MLNEWQAYLDQHGLEAFKKACYELSAQHNYAALLDSCQLQTGVIPGKYELLVALGAKKLHTKWKPGLFSDWKGKWMFGVLSYELKNRFEQLSSNNESAMELPELCFFEPELVFSVSRKGRITLHQGQLPSLPEMISGDQKGQGITLSPALSKSEYLDKIKQIQELILNGEVYELNFCREQVIHYEAFDPISFHRDLLQRSAVPMAAYFRADQHFVSSASMERYLACFDERVYSQPIKGTIRKGKSYEEDQQLIEQLSLSLKDRAENVMIVDLVRNDLAKICETGSINVDELFGIYSFLQVHQMISTVSGKLRENVALDELFRASFPMGSMTGAPKIAAMQKIEALENFRRNWYSGALGYLSPEGEFDFSVLIRSLIGDLQSKTLTYSTGGAITIDSIPEEEWNECMVKGKAIEELLIDYGIIAL